MRTEIDEQPEVLRRVLTQGQDEVRRIAAIIRQTAPRMVLFTARGTSDNAALYAKYLIEIELGIPVSLASNSTLTVYGARPNLRDQGSGAMRAGRAWLVPEPGT
jgi:glucosamine--fructose-6-phosphate aminotransferase (isomerizing)